MTSALAAGQRPQRWIARVSVDPETSTKARQFGLTRALELANLNQDRFLWEPGERGVRRDDKASTRRQQEAPT